MLTVRKQAHLFWRVFLLDPACLLRLIYERTIRVSFWILSFDQTLRQLENFGISKLMGELMGEFIGLHISTVERYHKQNIYKKI